MDQLPWEAKPEKEVIGTMKDREQTLASLAEHAIAYGSKKTDQIEIMVQDNYEISCEVNLGEVNKATKSQVVGASIRVVINSKLGSAYTNLLNQSAIEKSVNRAIAAAKASTPDKTWKDFPQKTKYQKLTGLWDESIPEKDPSVFVELSTQITKAVKEKNPAIIIGEAGTGGFYGWAAYANSNGLVTSDRGTGVYAYSVLVLPTETGMTPPAVSIDVNRLFQLDLDYIVNDSVKHVLLAQKSEKGKTEKGSIILAADALGSLMSYTLLEALKGENVVRGKSQLADKIDTPIAAKTLTFTDDGRFDGGYATALFDGEGIPQQTTSLIEKGKLRSFLWNNYWAHRHGTTSTGNASRNLRTGDVDTAPTNIVISTGTKSLDDMISESKSGYLVKGLQGVHSSNRETGDYSVVANPAYRIIDGELTGAVHGLMIAGNAFELIKKVDAVGNDLRRYLVGPGGSLIGPSIQFRDIQLIAKAD